MLSFYGQNPTLIAILDNCTIHHVQIVKDLFTDAVILVFYLRPYSPDFNPIEEPFSLKQHNDILRAVDDPQPLNLAAFESITSQQYNSWINDSGYY